MEIASIFLPLLGAIIAGFFGRLIGDRGAQAVTCGAMVVAALISVWLMIDVAYGGNARTVELMRWIDSGDFSVAWSLRFDALSAVMVFVVNVVSACVHVYSIGYMSHDKSKPRFMAYLSLFTFMMLMLVTADNMIQMFFGWEGVGLASYLLIGFWYDRPSANAASIKAFVVNRVGDFGLILGIFAIFSIFGTVYFDEIFAAVPEHRDATFTFLNFEGHALTIACLLLFIGAMGKSAQLGLHTWLPDAMEGPTPVSALIHAATMVTAGVFLLCRFSPVLEFAPDALMVITIVGAATALIAATIGMTQYDIKRVIAYSTMSQLGYMFFAIGVSAYGAAMFHLMTHAFFKALLFLGAGSVIHAMSDEQDMRKMGGLGPMIPRTAVMMWIGSLALAGVGIPIILGHGLGFAGFYSKDMILESAWAAGGTGQFAFWMGIAAALMTAFYSWRLLFMTFNGPFRSDEHVKAHVHESPLVMLAPLYVLAAGALFAGYIGYDHYVGKHYPEFWDETLLHLDSIMKAAKEVPAWVKILPVATGLAGIALAWLVYIRLPGSSTMVREGLFRPLHRLFFNKWFFDELYERLFVRSSFMLGRNFWKAGDGAVIDGLGPDGVSNATRSLAGTVSRLQSGYVFHYAFAMAIGIVVLVGWYLIRFL